MLKAEATAAQARLRLDTEELLLSAPAAATATASAPWGGEIFPLRQEAAVATAALARSSPVTGPAAAVNPPPLLTLHDRVDRVFAQLQRRAAAPHCLLHTGRLLGESTAPRLPEADAALAAPGGPAMQR